MAVVIDLFQSYDQSTSNDQDVAWGVHMISPVDTPLQLMLPKVQVSATKAEWLEDELIARTTTLGATVADTTAATITVATGAGTDLFPTDVATYPTIIRVDQEYMLVTAEASARKMTVTRGYGSTTAATHAASAVVHIINVLGFEGATAREPLMKARTRPSNYVQTFTRTIEVSGIQEVVRKLGGVTSEIGYSQMKEARSIALELEDTLIKGVAAAVGDRDTNYRTMAGLWPLVATNRTNDSGSLDTDAIEADILTIWDQGGNPNVLLTTGALAQDAANLYKDRIRTEVLTQIAGVNITTIINPLSDGPIYIVPHRQMPAGEYFLLDITRMALGFIRPFFMSYLAKVGDSDRFQLLGDYTLEMYNEKAQAYRRGFS